MKIKILLLFFALSALAGYAQIGINTPLPNPNTNFHISELTSTEHGIKRIPKGIIIPRISVEERNKLTYVDPLAGAKIIKLTAAENGLLIFNTTSTSYDFWSAPDKKWKQIDGVSEDTELGPGDLAPADFTVDCDDITPHGQYMLNESVDLQSQYYVSVKINVKKAGKYTAMLNSQAAVGIGFATSGVFNKAGDYTIRLKAQGTPLLEGNHEFTLKLNGKNVIQNGGTDICKPIISVFDPAVISPPKPIITKSMRMLTLGVNTKKDGFWQDKRTFTDSLSFRTMDSYQKQLLASENNFGPNSNSFVKFPGWARIYSFDEGYSDKPIDKPIRDQIKNLITGTDDYPPVDIIIIHQNFNNTFLITELLAYLDAGGVVLMYSGRNSSAISNRVMTHVFKKPTTLIVPNDTTTIETLAFDGSAEGYTFNNIIDPILIGPFKDIRGTHWMPGQSINKNKISYYVSDFYKGLDPADIHVISKDSNDNIFAFRHTKYNLFWMGSDGYIVYFNANFGMELSSRTPLPFIDNKTNFKRYGSYFFLNTIAWALQAAELTGINAQGK